MRGNAVNRLRDPAVLAVIGIAGNGRLTLFNLNQTVQRIPDVGERSIRGDIAIGVMRPGRYLIITAVNGGGRSAWVSVGSAKPVTPVT